MFEAGYFDTKKLVIFNNKEVLFLKKNIFTNVELLNYFQLKCKYLIFLLTIYRLNLIPNQLIPYPNLMQPTII